MIEPLPAAVEYGILLVLALLAVSGLTAQVWLWRRYARVAE